MPDKVFRDPLYNYVSIDASRDGWLLRLLDCPEVQRLRRIHQLGVSNYTYPGADHNRLAHSLGVVHLMMQVLDYLERSFEVEQVRAGRQALLAAALLHDTGHGPFSHLFEPCLGINHEVWSIRVVCDPESSVYKVLHSINPYLPAQVADLIEEKNPKPPAWQKALLSSQLDMDRVDYLRRDSLCTGAGYGHFNWMRLLNSVQLTALDGGGELVWPEKAANAIEEYVFARYYMYQNVYLHKTTRGFEKLIEAMWSRAKRLRADGTDVSLVPVITEFWSGNAPTLRQYLRIEEFTVLSQIQAWSDHSDKPLAELARRFLNRDGFVVIDPPPSVDALKPDYSAWEAALHEEVKKAGYAETAAFCLPDTLAGKYRRPYRPEKEKSQQSVSNSIRLAIVGESHPVEVSDYLLRLKAVTQEEPDRRRYYVPRNVRDAAKKLAKEWKQK